MIRIDAIWLATEPMDMRTGTETALTRVMPYSVPRNRTVLISLPIGGLYEVERQAKEMNDEGRWRLLQEIAALISVKLQEWLLAQRELVPEGWATAKALDYSLKRWVALTRYLVDGAVPIDNTLLRTRSDRGYLLV